MFALDGIKISVARIILLACVLLMLTASAGAQTCSNGQSPVWSSTVGWTCASPASQPLPTGSAVNMTIANAGATGTTINRLAKLTGAPSTAVITATTDTENAIGICTANCGTTGNATIAIIGQVPCDFDNATTAGNYVTISSTTAGKCHDAGSAFPNAQAAYGRVLSTNGASGTFVMELMTPDIAFQNAGNGKSKPGGSNTQIQFNNSGVFGGDAGITYDTATDILSVNGVIKPQSTNTQDLGSAALAWRDLNWSGALRATGNADIISNSTTLRWDGTALLGAGKDLGAAGNRWLNGYIGAASFATNAPAQITSNQNNYNPGAVAGYQLLTTDASRNITGWTFTDTSQDGRTFVIVNAGAQNIVLQNENASSTAANRFTNSTGADITLTPNQTAYVFRDVTAQRWRVWPEIGPVTGTGSVVLATSPTFTTSAISPLFRSTAAKVLLQGTGTGATQIAATQTTAPTCSASCGTSPSVVGTDSAGIVTMGATGSPASGWVITFNGTWASAPSCIVQSALAGMLVGKMPIVVATTTTTITVTTNGTAPGNSDKYQFQCIGTQ